MSDTPQFASLLPTDADQSGFLDGVTATIRTCRADTFDYNGTVATPVPAIKVVYEVEGAAKQPNPQHYTVGKPEHRVPSEDSRRFKVFGNKKALPKDSNGLLWLSSLVNGGFPTDKIGDDLSVFDNTVVLLRSEALPKREGANDAKQIILIDKVVTLPWDNTGKSATTASKAAPKAAAPKTAATPVAAAPVNEEAATVAATEALAAIFADAKYAKGIAKKDVGTVAFKSLSTNPNRNAAVKLLSVGLTGFIGDGLMVQVGAGDAAKVGMATISGDNVVWSE